MRLAGALLFYALALPPPGGPVSVRVTPQVAFEPGVFRILATVEPHEANRKLTITLESTTGRQSTSKALAGAEAPRFHRATFEGVPAGDYVVKVEVQRNDGRRNRAVQDVHVFSEEG